MSTPSEILRTLEAEHFTAVVAASPKKVREEAFRRAGIRNKGSAFALKSAGKNEARIKKLRTALLGGAELQDEIAEEVLRSYLYTKRPMLAEALDFLEVDNDEGLTDADLDFMMELPEDKATHLHDVLSRSHDPRDVDLYFAFMSIPNPKG